MRFQFQSKKLERLYAEEKGAKRYPAGVVAAFFEIMAVIAASESTRDLRALKGVRFERLKGDRKGQNSLRLNDQYRLIVRVEVSSSGEEIVVIEIIDYH